MIYDFSHSLHSYALSQFQTEIYVKCTETLDYFSTLVKSKFDQTIFVLKELFSTSEYNY